MFQSAFLCKSHDQVCCRLYNFLKAIYFLCFKAIIILPFITWQPTGNIVKTIYRVRFFNINFYRTIIFHFRMNDFCSVVKCHKRIDHIDHLPFKIILRHEYSIFIIVLQAAVSISKSKKTGKQRVFTVPLIIMDEQRKNLFLKILACSWSKVPN